MQPLLTASCRFDPYSNSNNGGCSEVIRDTAVKDTKPNSMKTLSALFAFIVVYYALWLLSLPVTIMNRFIIALAGDE